MLLDEGNNRTAVQAINKEMDYIRHVIRRFSKCTDQHTHNIAKYARYIELRVTHAILQGCDMVVAQSNPHNDNIITMLEDGSLDVLFQLVEPLTELRFFVDDFDTPAVLQVVQKIFDNFLFLYNRLCRTLLNLFSKQTVGCRSNELY